MAKGNLIVNIYSGSVANPIRGAVVTVSKEGRDLFTTTTNENGQTETIVLDTVDKRFTETDQKEIRPYETYDVTVTALGLTNTKVEGVQIFDGVTSIQDIYMTSIDTNQEEDIQEITGLSQKELENLARN